MKKQQLIIRPFLDDETIFMMKSTSLFEFQKALTRIKKIKLNRYCKYNITKNKMLFLINSIDFDRENRKATYKSYYLSIYKCRFFLWSRFSKHLIDLFIIIPYKVLIQLQQL